ncbi:MAG: acyl-[acyl-carrier-protein] thioesterase [Actinomycetota bacterium]
MAGDELVPRPARGRVFEARVRVRLADVAPSGRLRFDAIARMLQDVSGDDTADAGFEPDAAWVVRRLVIERPPARAPRLRDDLTLVTWCSGTGPRWAERRTDLLHGGGEEGGGEGAEEIARAAALWVLVDRRTGSPIPLGEGFDAVFGAAAGGRRVGQRLRHGPPPPGASRSPWPLRATDLDVLGHVNTAVYWAPVEEVLARLANRRRVVRAEIEFRGGIEPGDPVELVTEAAADELRVWLTVGPDVRGSAVLRLEPETGRVSRLKLVATAWTVGLVESLRAQLSRGR